jgi:hypothetical protein
MSHHLINLLRCLKSADRRKSALFCLWACLPKQLLNYTIVFFVALGTVNAAVLETKLDSTTIKLPYQTAREPHLGAVVIVKGGAPDWCPVLTTLSQKLAGNGWSAVLINCDPSVKEPWSKVSLKVVKQLREKGNKKVILLHYGEDLNKTFAFLQEIKGFFVDGVILLSAYDLNDEPKLPQKLNTQFYDVVGQFDYEPVMSQFSVRNETYSEPLYSSLELPGAPHDYSYAQASLVSFLNGWMQHLKEKPDEEPSVVDEKKK